MRELRGFLQDWHWIQNQRETNACQVPRHELNGVHGVSQGRWGCSGRMRKEPSGEGNQTSLIWNSLLELPEGA